MYFYTLEMSKVFCCELNIEHNSTCFVCLPFSVTSEDTPCDDLQQIAH